MKFIKPLDMWVYGDAVRRGQIKLQVGQWVHCGDQLSRFHHTNGMTITAFHGPKASQKFQSYCNSDRAMKHRMQRVA